MNKSKFHSTNQSILVKALTLSSLEMVGIGGEDGILLDAGHGNNGIKSIGMRYDEEFENQNFRF